MIPQRPLKYIISFLFLMSIWVLPAQNQEKDSIQIDSTRITNWGLRVGVNLIPSIQGWVQGANQAVDLIADYRVSKNWYIASEYGYNTYLGEEDFYDYTTQGNYFKLGFNYNTYQNWLDMNNEIYVGGRYAYANFTQQVTRVTEYNYGDYFPDNTVYPDFAKSPKLGAHWLEFVLGLKVETFKNLFLGAQVGFSKIIHEQQPENFENFYIPGIGKTSINNIGTTFSYTVSYLIPFKKK